MQEKLTRSALSIIEHTPREDLLRKRVFFLLLSVPKERGPECTQDETSINFSFGEYLLRHPKKVLKGVMETNVASHRTSVSELIKN